MKYCLTILFSLATISLFQLCQGAEAQRQIEWMTNYEQAVQRANSESKPLLLFFTGSDWCGWCNKLEQEVLDTGEFFNAVGDKFVFVKLDFPREKSIDPMTKEQNRQLKSQFDIRSYPTIIVYDAKLNQKIGVTGYRPGGSRQYADHLLRMLADYQSYLKTLQNAGGLSGGELKRLYEKAQEFDFGNDLHRIVDLGLQSDQKLFFQIERYRMLADEGMAHTSKAIELKRQVLAADPTNAYKTHYQVAIIDFEAISDDGDKVPEHLVAPLVNYIETYGTQDRENLWRLQMIVSQVYLDNNKLSQALKHAQSCYEVAPATIRPEVALAIKNIQNQSQSK